MSRDVEHPADDSKETERGEKDREVELVAPIVSPFNSPALADTAPVAVVRRFDGPPPSFSDPTPDHPFFGDPDESSETYDDEPLELLPASTGDTTSPGVFVLAKSDSNEHTRELPVVRAEELWLVHDRPPQVLKAGTEIVINLHNVNILSCIAVQTFERRYRVAVDGFEHPVMLKQGAKGAQFVRYELEAEILKKVQASEENLRFPKFYDYWEDDECKYLLTELPGGRPYFNLLESGELELRDHVRILQEVAAILRTLHHLGYVLTSLRPMSFDVTVNRGYEVRLTDFLNVCETVERPPYALASPFTAPEITELGPADEGADIFSIGALLHRIVTGEDVPGERVHGLFIPQLVDAQVPMVFQLLARSLGSPSERFFDIEELEKAFQQLERELIPRLRVSTTMRTSTGINPLRIVNQDSGGFIERKSLHRSIQTHTGFYCVADGMGGHEDGDRASELAVQGALRCYEQLSLELNHDQWRDGCALLCRRIAAAGSRNLVETITRSGGGRRMGTTFTGVLVVDNQLALAHIGDSRAILFRNNQLEFLSEDHSLVGMMVKAGQMTEEQAERADEKNILMRSVGAEHIIQAEMFDGFESTLGAKVFTAEPGDRLVLVSDGVWGMIPRIDMVEVFRRTKACDDLCDALCSEAIKRGGGDNVIVVALDFREEPSFTR